MLPKKNTKMWAEQTDQKKISCDSQPSHLNVVGVMKASIIYKVKLKDQN